MAVGALLGEVLKTLDGRELSTTNFLVYALFIAAAADLLGRVKADHLPLFGRMREH